MRAREEGKLDGKHGPWTSERWPLTKLIPYARNARTHSDEQACAARGPGGIRRSQCLGWRLGADDSRARVCGTVA
jgi:hypothetical protein